MNSQEALELWLNASDDWMKNPTDEGYELLSGLRNQWLKCLDSEQKKLNIEQEFELDIDELNEKYKDEIELTDEDAYYVPQSNFDYNKAILDTMKLNKQITPDEYNLKLKKLIETKRKEQIKFDAVNRIEKQEFNSNQTEQTLYF